MSDGKDPLSDPPTGKGSLPKSSLVAIETSGKDPLIWEKRHLRFHERLLNSLKSIFGGDIPPSATANEEFKTAVDIMGASAVEALKTPQLKNVERQASVRLKLAEAREREAQARKIELEADMMELELEAERRNKVLESQKVIDTLLQRGELVMIEKREDEYIFVYKEHPR